MNVIKMLDVFSQETKILVHEGSSRNRNYIGGTLSILAYIVILGAVGYFTRIFFAREKSTIITNIENTEDVIVPDLHNIPFMIRITDGMKRIVDDQKRLFEIVGSRWWTVVNKTDPEKKRVLEGEWIKFEYCTMDMIHSDYKYLFENKTDLTSFLCPQFPRPASIVGLYGSSNYFDFPLYYIRPCVPANTNNPFDIYRKGTRDDCYGKNFINDYLTAAYLEYKTIEYSIENFKEKPNKPVVFSQRTPISNTVWKRMWIYYQSIVYNSDIGYIFEDLISSTFFQINAITNDVDLRHVALDEVTDAFLWLTLVNSKKKMHYYRSYLKAQQLLANIGGITKGILIIGIFLNYFISKKYENLMIMQNRIEYANFKDNKKGKPAILQFDDLVNNYISNQIAPVGKKSRIDNSENANSSAQNPGFVKRVNKEILIENNKPTVNLSFMKIICPLKFFGSSENVKIYDAAVLKIEKNLNILELLKKLTQAQHLKNFVLNYDQLKVFDYIFENRCSRDETDYLVTAQAYNRINQNPDKSENDCKILELMNSIILK